MQAIAEKTSLHSVYAVDKEGISKIFIELQQCWLHKQATMQRSYTFLPKILDRKPDILQKGYPAQLILYSMWEKVIDASTTLQGITGSSS